MEPHGRGGNAEGPPAFGQRSAWMDAKVLDHPPPLRIPEYGIPRCGPRLRRFLDRFAKGSSDPRPHLLPPPPFLATQLQPSPVLLGGPRVRSALRVLLEHEADQVPLLVAVLCRPDHGRERVHRDSLARALPFRDKRREFLPDERSELAAARVDEDELLVVQIISDVGPPHLDGLANNLLLVLVEGHEDALLAVVKAAPDG